MIYNHTVHPARGQVLLQEDDREVKSKAGLTVVTGGKARRQMTDEEVEARFSAQCFVRALGPMPLNENLQEFPLDGLKVGDLVLIQKNYSAVPVIVDDKRLLLVPLGAIVARLVPNASNGQATQE